MAALVRLLSSPPMTQERDRGFENSTIILSLSLVTLGLGFAVQVVLAASLGVGRRMDVFLVASTLPTLVASVAISVFAYVLVPLLKEQEASAPYAHALLVGRIARATAVLAVSAALALGVAAPWLVGVLAPGFDAASAATAARLLRIMAVGAGFDILRCALTGLEYSRERFLLPQLAPSLHHALLLASALLLLRPLGLTGLALGWTAGSIAMFLCVAGAARGVLRAGHRGPKTGEPGTALRDLLLPVVAVVAAGQLAPVVDRLVASTLEPGAISALGYGSKLLEILLRTVPMAIGLAAFPVLSARAARNDWVGLADAFTAAARRLLLAVAPVAAIVVTLRVEIVQVLFERGAFDRIATAQVAAACGWYTVAFVPAAVLYLLQSLVLALRRAWALVAVGGGALLATAVLDVTLSRAIGFLGIAVAYLCVVSLQCVAVSWYLARAWPALAPRRLGPLALQVGGGVGGVVLALGWALPWVWPAGSGGALARVSAGAAAACVVYVTVLVAAGNGEVRHGMSEIARLLRRWSAGRGQPA
jgi:putative peptidoglycan lipid II flippase